MDTPSFISESEASPDIEKKHRIGLKIAAIMFMSINRMKILVK